ncbi:MAG: UDP-glucose/GDP-mannose dehydrogenase family protein [Candidatus Doudnabacteria bacterium]|nr:UDP-glucose/GDP-mannose dehydrogenase family protein [Candidatus Doudnabacteria bacterium]
MKIGIMGLGYVGGATCKFLESKKIKVYKYDKYKKIGSVAEVNSSDIVFICVPTPYNKNGFDLSFVEAAIQVLENSKTIVIKSSVVPGTTENLQKKYPKHKFLFNPEFLKEVSAYQDFIHPDRQIVGYTSKSKTVAVDVLKLLPKSSYSETMPATEAETVKYMANTFLSLKVVFANEFFELCRGLGLNYEEVRLAVGEDKRISPSHLDVAHGGYRGYGGSCFPKDVNAILEFAEKKKVKMPLLKAMREVNRKLLKKSGLSEEYFLRNKHKNPNDPKKVKN